MRVGEALPGVVASYLNSLEFTRRGLIGPTRIGEVETTETDGFTIYTARDDAAVGRHVQARNYEREVTAVFRRVLRPGMRIVDIGANIGYFSMLAATLVGAAGTVLAIEPNPRNVRLLEASRRANRFAQMRVLQLAAGRESGLLVLNTSHSNGTTSDLPDAVESLLDAETVPCMRLDALLDPDARLDFIKVDVEGAEYNALLGGEAAIRRCRPAIVSEFSPSLLPGISGISGAGYLDWLIGLGYDLAVIEPDGSLAAAGGDRGKVLQGFAARGTDHIDIMAVPREDTVAMPRND